ncbi:zinc finger SWIM domain-containing protein 7 [Callorhinchus milii]|uniref:Zinc finger SWIM-type containing 7 n=1 Tax=Callorhinchus milii TaxID=7868 RepID=V9LIP6_CALMI|nr:zinc finger SWIM domain-containing protein 7 [Callorhinchus milii]|eukprot:gi/632957773/ref/XP_007894667.1/ PREDICTED: zinc finger SWIM domain-containing protein 7 [Callorhinchus milii]
MSAGTLSVIAEELLKEVKKVYQESSQLTDELLLALKFIFGSTALHALDLVDQCSVTLISSPSGRTVYQVLGSSRQTYICLSFCHYCSCPAFMYSVIRRNDNILCKHILAAYLCQAMGLCHDQKVSDKQLTSLLLAKHNGS